MSRTAVAVVVAAVLVVAGGVAAAVVVLTGDDSSDAASTTETSTGSRTMTIRVLASVTKATPVDLPPRNVQNKGDRVFVESQLRNAVPQFGRPKGSIVGIDYSTITYLSSTKRLVSVQVTLPGGGLRLRATLDVSNPDALVKIPVISGTRDFNGATGYSEARSASGEQTLNIYHLRLP
ncbi:hypothetical protein [Gaiella sp.]|jgi:hypothetical protein|uniref:hypothetical protein n=1 Tax=Gaiella sp. TaxID=2663207 RepID=UPI002E37F6BE|nr:hypothetical protein [Gaiella sp.]HEX5583587.1 hypothetical protein [Gaiella sp.]